MALSAPTMTPETAAPNAPLEAPLRTAQALAPRIAERAEEIETARRQPTDLAREMAEAGLFRLFIPKEIGGHECEPVEALEVLEVLGRADGSVGWCTMIASTAALVSAYLPRDQAEAIYGRRDVITNGVFAPTGKAELDGDEYIVSGRWQWASGSANCDWLAGGCMVLENGEMARLPNGAPASRMVLFPFEEGQLIDTWHASGLRGTGSGDMAVEGIRVPKARSVSLMTDRPWTEAPLFRFPAFALLAMGVAAVALGNARGALEDLKELAAAKKRQGARKTLAESVTNQSELAKAEAQLLSARSFLFEETRTAYEAAATGGELAQERRAGLRLAATHATRTASEVARIAYDLGGGASVFESCPLQRRFRDAHVATQHLMVGPQIYETAGRAFFGLDVDPTFL